MIHFLKDRFPELLFISKWILFSLPTLCRWQSPDQNKRSLAINFKETRSILLHFLLSFGNHGICFFIISNRSPSHPEHPCICGCKIKTKKNHKTKTPYKTSAVRNSWRFSRLAPNSTQFNILQTILAGARPNPYRTRYTALKKQNRKSVVIQMEE